MVVQTKRKNTETAEENQEITKGSAKKLKKDISWLTDGIAGADPFDGKFLFLLFPKKLADFKCILQLYCSVEEVRI